MIRSAFSFLTFWFQVTTLIYKSFLIISSFVDLQEIKFEPCVMCEHLDKRTSFRLSQVGVSLCSYYCFFSCNCPSSDILCLLVFFFSFSD